MQHSRNQQPQTRAQKTELKILQVNVGRSGIANDLALQYAYQHAFDLLLIQEPWIGSDLERQMSKKHIAFQAHVPEENWTERPRVITYVQRNLAEFMIEKRQDLLTANPDILVLELNMGIDVKPIYVVNLYNAPVGCARAGEVITAMLETTILTEQRTLWAGDCNLHHEDWDVRTKNPTPQAQGFAEWVTSNGAHYGLDIGSVTHRQGGTLDLVIASRLLAQDLIECYTEDSLDTTSDH